MQKIKKGTRVQYKGMVGLVQMVKEVLPDEKIRIKPVNSKSKTSLVVSTSDVIVL